MIDERCVRVELIHEWDVVLNLESFDLAVIRQSDILQVNVSLFMR